MIFYFCPDFKFASAGIRILYRHVEILNKHGFSAAILRDKANLLSDLPVVPIRYIQASDSFSAEDVVVIPEGFGNVMASFKPYPVRRIAIALNWQYIYQSLPDRVDWRELGIERVLTHSSFIADYVTWAMQLPSHIFVWGIKPEYYYFDAAVKARQVSFLQRKQKVMPEIMRLIYSRNPEFFTQIKWLGLGDLSEADYAGMIRRSALFLNTSEAEGLPCSMLEAMRAGALVAGYNSVGGQRELIGSGEKQNCLLVENLDYPALARRIEPFLDDLLVGDMSRWGPILTNGFATAGAYNLSAEEISIVSLWQDLL